MQELETMDPSKNCHLYVNCPNCKSKLKVKDDQPLPAYMCPKCDHVFTADPSKEVNEKHYNYSWKDVILPYWLYLLTLASTGLFIADIIQIISYRYFLHKPIPSEVRIEMVIMFWFGPIFYGLSRYFIKKLEPHI